MQVLTEKNTRLSQELEECKTQLGPLLPHCRNRKSLPLVTFILKNGGYHIVCSVSADLTIDFADESGAGIRKDENYEKNYLIGRYGAIPALKSINIFKE